MKLTLISPYSNFNSYGIKSISTYLRNSGISVSTIYLINNFGTPYKRKIFDQLVELCQDSDLIGISVMSNYFMNCVQITSELKNKLKIPIIWGGVHATIEPEECLQYCDVAAMGEGEQTLLEIINSIKKSKPIYDIQGAFVRHEDKIFKNNIRPLLPAESLPTVDNDFSSDYVLVKNRILNLSHTILQNFMSRDYCTMTSFGCPLSCNYCINNKLKAMYGSSVRFRKDDDIIYELSVAREKCLL